MTGILDRIRATTPETLAGVTGDFSDAPRPVITPKAPKNMVRIVEGATDLKVDRPDPQFPGMVKTSDWTEDYSPVCGPVDARSEGQVRYMDNLIEWITEKDQAAGDAARVWTDNVTAAGKWEIGRDNPSKFSISGWINRLKAKNADLNDAAKQAPPVTVTNVPSGNVQHDELIVRETKSGKPMPQYYAVELEGTLKFYRIKAGTKPGWWWIEAQASDEFHPIKNVSTKNTILRAIIAAGPEACMRRYGQEINHCGRCHRTLTDATSRANGIGPECEGKL